MTNSAAVEVLGWLGGVCIALSLLPQVAKTYNTKSAGDISYAYQTIYIIGCTLVNIYAITYALWPVYIPCLVEETLIITLTIMKFIYEKKQSSCDDESKEEDHNNHDSEATDGFADSGT
eukprot:CAMPEP_0181089494 /NCGR_PEP_ID=MMETSP1071-20121207/7336_1 /TAXON_ID=35127 /ORGANISM="Thalassiosira sp., Strain NH16" /LENGTH=118 /DNA_ID=CAMNT_0023171453 /DNA_START=21 /DNA_END=377 /DNA_ORIENTATION=-